MSVSVGGFCNPAINWQIVYNVIPPSPQTQLGKATPTGRNWVRNKHWLEKWTTEPTSMLTLTWNLSSSIKGLYSWLLKHLTGIFFFLVDDLRSHAGLTLCFSPAVLFYFSLFSWVIWKSNNFSLLLQHYVFCKWPLAFTQSMKKKWNKSYECAYKHANATN